MSFQKGFKKKIFLGIGLFLVFVFLISILFSLILPKKQQKENKFLKEKERIRKEIEELEKKKKEIEEGTTKKEIEKRIAEILTQVSAQEDITVNGVEIIKKEDKKLIRNKEQGYEIEIPAKMLLARSINSEELNFYTPNPDDSYLLCPGWPSVQSDLKISIEKIPETLPFEKWIEKNRKDIYSTQTEQISYFEDFGWQKINDNNWYKIEFWIERLLPIPIHEYLLVKDNKIYIVSIVTWEGVFKEECPYKFDWREIEKTLETFKLI